MYTITGDSASYISDTIVPIRVTKNGCYVREDVNPDGFTVMVPVTMTKLETKVFALPGHTLKGTEPTATYEETSAVSMITGLEDSVEQACKLSQINQNAGWTAARLYKTGEYITIYDALYRITLDIPAGSRIAPGANCVQTTISNEINKLTKEE